MRHDMSVENMNKEKNNNFKEIRNVYRNPSLGLVTKAKVYKGVGQEVCEGVSTKTHTPKWAPILEVGVPVDSQTFKERL